jgi:hypothetical protein
VQTFQGDPTLPNPGQPRSAWAVETAGASVHASGASGNWIENQSYPESTVSCQV